jgi:hypothetical protein
MGVLAWALYLRLARCHRALSQSAVGRGTCLPAGGVACHAVAGNFSAVRPCRERTCDACAELPASLPHTGGLWHRTPFWQKRPRWRAACCADGRDGPSGPSGTAKASSRCLPLPCAEGPLGPPVAPVAPHGPSGAPPQAAHDGLGTELPCRIEFSVKAPTVGGGLAGNSARPAQARATQGVAPQKLPAKRWQATPPPGRQHAPEGVSCQSPPTPDAVTRHAGDNHPGRNGTDSRCPPRTVGRCVRP